MKILQIVTALLLCTFPVMAETGLGSRIHLGKRSGGFIELQSSGTLG